MAVELTIVESVTELETTVVEVILESASTPGPAGVGVPTGGTVGQVLTKQSVTDYDTDWEDATGGPGGGVTDADYLVGTAHPDLSAEIVVGTSPGGELGGTWASPSVDATHSGSSHASVQAAAEATAAAALTTHTADTTAVHGIADTSALALTANHPTNATFNDHSARHENGGADEISIAGLDGTSVELAAHLADAADAHDASAVSVVPFATIAATTVQAALEEIVAEAGGGSGEALQRDINQTGHGLAVGNIVRLNGSSWQKAQANSAANAEAVGIVAVVIDTDNFTLHYGGRITGLSGLSAGSVYYLDDDTAGLLTTTEPPDAGDVSKPLLIADTTTTGYFFNWRGAINVDMATQAELDAHVNDTSAAHAASAISADSTTLVGTGTDVQAVLEELDNGIADHLADTSDAHDASAISVADSGAFYTATDVEGVLAEIAPQLGGGDFVFIDEIAVGSGGAANVDFTSISGAYRHLRIAWVAQTENAAAQNLFARLNNDSGANYTWAQADVQAGGTASLGAQTEGLIGVLAATGDTYPSMGEVTIAYYTGTVWKKVVRGVCNAFYSGSPRQTLQQSLWDNTAAITRITIFATSDLKEGSVFSLYGIT